MGLLMNSNYLKNKSNTSVFEKASCLIIEKARKLTDQLIEQRGNSKPPFLPEEIAPLLGIRGIIKADLGETSAVLLRFRDGPIIKVNQNHYQNKCNFSCAHEIGHILFDELGLEPYIAGIEYRGTFDPQGQAFAYSNAKERLCDIAARELLMPEAIFKDHLLGFGLSVSSIPLLSKAFKASIHAVALRIEEVCPESCVILQCQLRKKRRSRTLHLSNARRQSYCTLVNSRVEPNSSLYKAFKTDNIVKGHRDFKISNEKKRLPIESKGFGYGENRKVYSLVFLER